MLCRTTLFAISLISLSAQAYAQSTSYQSPAATVAPQVVMPGYPGYYARSSTLQEGIQHGYADVLRAEGDQAYNIARAADQFELAREKWLNNRQHAVQQYFALREANQAHRKAEQGKPSTKTVARAKADRTATTTTVSVVRYDGQIEWPAAVAGLDASDARNELERLFNDRAAGRQIRKGSTEYRQGCEAIAKMQGQLKDSIKTLPTAEYMAAQKALTGLKHDLTQPVVQNLLTQN